MMECTTVPAMMNEISLNVVDTLTCRREQTSLLLPCLAVTCLHSLLLAPVGKHLMIVPLLPLMATRADHHRLCLAMARPRGTRRIDSRRGSTSGPPMILRHVVSRRLVVVLLPHCDSCVSERTEQPLHSASPRPTRPVPTRRDAT